MESLFNSCNKQLDELQKIVDSFIIISEKEKNDLLDSAYSLICDTVNSDPMLYINPTFHETVVVNTCDLLKHQLGDIFTGSIDDVLHKIVEEAMMMFYSQNAPIRSYKNTFIRKPCNIEKTTKKIDYLRSVPQPEQRTPEWYEFRQKVLTASNIWKTFSTPNTRNQLIYEKCCPFDKEKYNNFGTNTESPMHWGQKYEPVSVMYYERTYNTKVGDFGCIPHKLYNSIAASPDGINIKIDSDRYGRMLEVKNIVNRVIDGVPKMEYWVQMQVQMEVCNLNECDFLETRFIEYDNEEAYYAETDNSKPRGMMMCFNNGGRPLYVYSEWGVSKDDLEVWEQKQMEQYSNYMWINNIYWKLEEVSCVLVLRNKLWFNYAKPMIDEIWEIIDREKENGDYKKREPKKKLNKNANAETVVKKSGCLIDMNLFNVNEETNVNISVYDISGSEVDISCDMDDFMDEA
jgi:putative phage-type endonuclease